MDMVGGGRISSEGARTGHVHSPSDVGAIPLSSLNEKGDLIVATGNDAYYVLPVGAEGTALSLEPGSLPGVSWQPVSRPGHTHTQTQSHLSPDTDSSENALHHTLGTGPSQAAPGNHTHVDIMPIGAIVPFAGANAPAGYLVCDGSVKPASEFSVLAGICGDRYGTAPAGSFRLPDLRGRTAMGVDTTQDFSPLGKPAGARTVTLTEAQLPAHKHTASATGLSVSGQTVSGITISEMTFTGNSTGTAGDHTHTTSGSVGGGGHGHWVSISAGSVVTNVTSNDNSNTAGSGGLTRVSSLNVSKNSVVAFTAALAGTDGAHSHTFTGSSTGPEGGHSHTVTGTVTGGTASGGSVSEGSVTGTIDVANTGSGADVPILPPYLALTYIIKAL